MKIKELITKLEKQLELHGDVDVKYFNEYWLELDDVFIDSYSEEDDCLLIKMNLD